MFKSSTTIAATLLALTLGAAGCATQPAEKPTHYWESKTASSLDYRKDQSACEQAADLEAANGDGYVEDSASFEDYRQCMISRGYTLRTY